MSDQYTPTSVANEALDAAGIDYVLGDIADGTRPSQVILRHYSPCLGQLLRSVLWDFARREASLQLVADASGQDPLVGRLVPAGFMFSYNLPTDCAKVRFLPANYWDTSTPAPAGNIVPASNTSPLVTGELVPPLGARLIPTRFLLTSDPNYIPDGAANNIRGISPIGQTLILSNVRNARCVYTFEASYPNLWESLFREAMVAFLASKIAFPLAQNKRDARLLRADNIAIAQAAVKQAAATNGNESFSDSGLAVDWMQFRNSGGWGTGWGSALGAGPGYFFGGVDGIGWGLGTGNSSAY